jgi:hypothetical protein
MVVEQYFQQSYVILAQWKIFSAENLHNSAKGFSIFIFQNLFLALSLTVLAK